VLRIKLTSTATAMLIAAAASFWAAPASAVVVADPTDTYTVIGSYTNSIDPNISGTLTVDLKTDKVTIANINTGSTSSGGFGTYTTIGSQGVLGANYFVDLTNNTGFTFFLLLDTSSSLFNGQTTTIDPNSNFFFGFFPCFSCGNFTGTLNVTTVSAAVPEPSTWAMIILGFLGIGLVAYRRTNTRLRLT
jgi:hypothetical protein